MSGMTEIVGITRVTRGKANKAGNLILAYFDARTGGLLLKGCSLARLKNGTVTVWPPRLQTEGDNRRGVKIEDQELRQAMLASAIAAFKAVGGTEAELRG